MYKILFCNILRALRPSRAEQLNSRGGPEISTLLTFLFMIQFVWNMALLHDVFVLWSVLFYNVV